MFCAILAVHGTSAECKVKVQTQCHTHALSCAVPAGRCYWFPGDLGPAQREQLKSDTRVLEEISSRFCKKTLKESLGWSAWLHKLTWIGDCSRIKLVYHVWSPEHHWKPCVIDVNMYDTQHLAYGQSRNTHYIYLPKAKNVLFL